EYSRPADIEKRSMELISREMKTVPPKYHAPVIRRVIHTTADFEYEQTLVFSGNAVTSALTALRAARSSAESDILSSVTIVTDTNMALSGINKGALSRLNCRAVCYMADPAVAEDAERRGVTRAAVSMEKAAELKGPLIFAIGNAPTALLRLKELIDADAVRPELVVGVPVGFVNVVESKELIMESDVPYIVARGRKGGSTVAAAICNALLYMAEEDM
ncbi:MAG: precorrin-8X methylmutase, partial [Anaerovoracaceae bacterium]